MESNRWKTASLAINAIIRGLELDQVTFQYDERACLELVNLTGGTGWVAGDGRADLAGTAPSLAD